MDNLLQLSCIPLSQNIPSLLLLIRGHNFRDEEKHDSMQEVIDSLDSVYQSSIDCQTPIYLSLATTRPSHLYLLDNDLQSLHEKALRSIVVRDSDWHGSGGITPNSKVLGVHFPLLFNIIHEIRFWLHRHFLQKSPHLHSSEQV